MTEIVTIGDATLYHGDCLEILPTLEMAHAVVTDPPYPDQHQELYRYLPRALKELSIHRGLVFWSARADFPLDYSSIHIWDKRVGCGSEYERIFEIGGNKEWKIFRYSMINSEVTARFASDELAGHPSQKPIGLMVALVARTRGIVIDPFMGSGSTGTACARLGRKFIGIEIERKYFDIACERIENAQRQSLIFEVAPSNPET